MHGQGELKLRIDIAYTSGSAPAATAGWLGRFAGRGARVQQLMGALRSGLGDQGISSSSDSTSSAAAQASRSSTRTREQKQQQQQESKQQQQRPMLECSSQRKEDQRRQWRPECATSKPRLVL